MLLFILGLHNQTEKNGCRRKKGKQPHAQVSVDKIDTKYSSFEF